MAFMPFSYDDGQPRPWEYIPCDDITVTVGTALYQSSGLLVKATGTTKPTYICMMEAPAAVAAGTLIPVVAVQPDIIF